MSVLTHMSIGIGELYLFGSVASWVAYTLLVKKVAGTMENGVMTAVSTMMGAVMLLMISIVKEDQWQSVLSVSNQTMLEILYLAVCSTVFAFLLFNWGVKRIGATKASAYINLTPLNAAWIAVLLYGETISAYHLLGMAVTITGVLITTRNKVQPVASDASNIAASKV